MSGLKLYYDLFSQPSRALYIFLKVVNIPFEAKPIRIIELEHTTPEFEAINPFKKVPIIEHNDFKLTESIAILRYLSREYKVPQHWYPSSSREQAKVDEYLEWQHLNTRLKCSSYFLVTFLKPLRTGKPAKPEQIKKYKTQMLDCLDSIENIWLKDKLFLTGNEINISDIFGACELEQLRLAGYDPRAEWPCINAWMERVQQETRPYYDEAHKLLNKFVKQQDQTAKHGYLGFFIHGGKWKFHNILPIFHASPNAVLVYAHLLILGLNSGHVCIYCVANWNILDLNSTLARLIILGTEPIISLNISAHFKEHIIAANIKRVHFIDFM